MAQQLFLKDAVDPDDIFSEYGVQVIKACTEAMVSEHQSVPLTWLRCMLQASDAVCTEALCVFA